MDTCKILYITWPHATCWQLWQHQDECVDHLCLTHYIMQGHWRNTPKSQTLDTLYNWCHPLPPPVLSDKSLISYRRLLSNELLFILAGIDLLWNSFLLKHIIHYNLYWFLSLQQQQTKWGHWLIGVYSISMYESFIIFPYLVELLARQISW
jgi:hypothetical protein